MRLSFKSEQESGRSMVEILGVIAIGAVLGVGSIALFQYARDTIHANTIISEVRVRLLALSRHGASKNEAISRQTLKGFQKKPDQDLILDKYQVTLSQPLGEGPTLNIGGISPSICKRLKSIITVPIKINDAELSIAECQAENIAQFDLSFINEIIIK